MQTVAMLMMAVLTLSAAVYVHYRVRFHTANSKNRWFVHGLLMIIGIGFGWVNGQQYPVTGLMWALVFLSSFGVVHVPAAAILFIKRQQKN